MTEPYRAHPTDENLERFLLNICQAEERELIEIHILACESCVDQLEALEIEIAATRLALKRIRPAKSMPRVSLKVIDGPPENVISIDRRSAHVCGPK